MAPLVAAAPVVELPTSVATATPVPYYTSNALAYIMNPKANRSALQVRREAVTPFVRNIVQEPVKALTALGESAVYTLGIIADKMMHAAIRIVLYGGVPVDTMYETNASESYGWIMNPLAGAYLKPRGLAAVLESVVVNIANADYASCTRESKLIMDSVYGDGDKDLSEAHEDWRDVKIARQRFLNAMSAVIELDMHFSRHLGSSLSIAAAGIVSYKFTISTLAIEQFLVKEPVTEAQLYPQLPLANTQVNLWASGRLQLRKRPFDTPWGSKQLTQAYDSRTCLHGVYFVADVAMFTEAVSRMVMTDENPMPALEQVTVVKNISSQNPSDHVVYTYDLSASLQAPHAATFFMVRRNDFDWYRTDAGALPEAPDVLLDPIVEVEQKLNGAPLHKMDAKTSRQTFGIWSGNRTNGLQFAMISSSLNAGAAHHSSAIPLNRAKMTFDLKIHPACFSGGNTVVKLTIVTFYYNVEGKSAACPFMMYMSVRGLHK